jgi:hypothetical protein
MPIESASRLVRSAVERGFTEKDLGKMERDVVEGLGKGKRMDDVVRSTESGISHERKGEDRGSDRGRGGSRESGSERGKDKDTDRSGSGDRGGKGGSHGQ